MLAKLASFEVVGEVRRELKQFVIFKTSTGNEIESQQYDLSAHFFFWKCIFVGIRFVRGRLIDEFHCAKEVVAFMYDVVMILF